MTVYAIASGKGGVGKTTTAIALAACAGAAGSSAVVVDADLGMADVGTFLGLEGGPTLHDVLADGADLEDAVREVDGFDALPAGTDLDGYAAADPAGLREVVADLAERYDVVVLDAGAGLSHDTVLPLGLADEVVLVSTPDEVSVVDAEKTRQMAERVGGRLRGVVFTRAVEADLDDLSAGMGLDLLGVVPADDAVGRAAEASEPVPAFAPGSPAGTAYMDIAATLFELPVTSISFAEDAGTDIEDAAVEPFPGESSGADEAGDDTGAAESGATPQEEADDAAADGDQHGNDDSDDERGGFLSRLFGR